MEEKVIRRKERKRHKYLQGFGRGQVYLYEEYACMMQTICEEGDSSQEPGCNRSSHASRLVQYKLFMACRNRSEYKPCASCPNRIGSVPLSRGLQPQLHHLVPPA